MKTAVAHLTKRRYVFGTIQNQASIERRGITTYVDERVVQNSPSLRNFGSGHHGVMILSRSQGDNPTVVVASWTTKGATPALQTHSLPVPGYKNQ